jgi:uncharacterized membrane protein YeaQ/YmgE (transglycosylase-associated protein family)
MFFRWAIVLGIVGLSAGYIGPLVLSPDSNQGPLLGIFISGPAGALLGAVLGALASIFALPSRINALILCVAAVALAATTLYLCIPQARPVADIVVGETRACVSAQSLKAATVARLEAIEQSRPDAGSTRWSEVFDQALYRNPGVVITLQVQRERHVFEAQAPWNRGALQADSWTEPGVSATYFVARSDCGSLPTGAKSIFGLRGNTGIWRPSGIAQILDMKIAEPLPSRYAIFAEDR